MNSIFFTFLISLTPILELGGAIPYALAHGIEPLWALVISVFENLLPTPFIILLIRKIFAFLKTYPRISDLILRLEKRAHLKGRIIQRYRLYGLAILVAVPLPGTGAWTGALVAGLLDIQLRKALPAIFVGLVIAGVIILILSLGVSGLFF